MNSDLENRIISFVKEIKNGMFYDDDGNEIEQIDFNNFANIDMFLNTAVALLEEVVGEKNSLN